MHLVSLEASSGSGQPSWRAFVKVLSSLTPLLLVLISKGGARYPGVCDATSSSWAQHYSAGSCLASSLRAHNSNACSLACGLA